MDPLLIVTTALSGVWGNRMDWLATEAGKAFWDRIAERSRKLPGDSPLQLACAQALQRAGMVLHDSLQDVSEHQKLGRSAKKYRKAWLKHVKKQVGSLGSLLPSEDTGFRPGESEPPDAIHFALLKWIRLGAPAGEPSELEPWVLDGWFIIDGGRGTKRTFYEIFQLHFRRLLLQQEGAFRQTVLEILEGLPLPDGAEPITEEKLAAAFGSLLHEEILPLFEQLDEAAAERKEILERLDDLLALQKRLPDRLASVAEPVDGVDPNEILVEELKEKIADGQVVLVVGSGVSIGATSGNPTASWKGLLEHGLEHCRNYLNLGARWVEKRKEDLDSDMFDMLTVAEQISTRLEAPEGEFIAWLVSAFDAKNYQLVDRSVIDGLEALRCPIVTTNYDELIERATGRQHAVWNRDQHRLGRILQFQDKAVLHVHGFWNAPDSVVLGIKDYEKVKQDPHTEAFMRVISMARCLLFVGCGDGLEDPHFEALLQWMEKTKAKMPGRSFRLARSSEVKQLQDKHPLGQRITLLSYGETHDELPAFLARLAPGVKAAAEEPQEELGAAWTAYLDFLTRENATMPLAGLGSAIAVSLPIESAYIPLKACHVERFSDKPGAEKFDAGRHGRAELAEHDLSLVDLFKTSPRRGVLLLGNPGAGKTTGLRQWCWRLASGDGIPSDFDLPAGCVPVFLKLRNLPPAPKSFAKNKKRFFDRFLDSELRVRRELGDDIELAGELESLKSPLLWLVDGLDEIADEPLRKAVFKWLTGILKERGQDHMLVAGRYQGVEGVIERGDAFSRFEVQPLSSEQSRQFVRVWFETTYAKLKEPSEKAGQKSADLIEVLDSEAYRFSTLKALKSNPLLLTILCVVFHEDTDLPEERSKVYDRCVRVMLDSWRKGKELPVGYDSAAARSMLARVAWWLHHEENRRSAPLAEMEAFAESLLSGYPNAKLPDTGKEFIAIMKNQAGVLAALGDGDAEFLHLTFQEYLAADHAARENLGAELAGFFGVPWWREATLLALSQGSLDFSVKFFGALLVGDAAKRDAGFFDECLRASRELSWGIFAAALREGDDARRLAQLKVLRNFPSAEVLEVCLELRTGSVSGEVRALADEIARAAGEPPVTEQAMATEENEWTHPQSGTVFVRIRAGSFLMGSPDDEAERHNDETQHEVTLSEDFWIAKYPVTNEVYERFVKAAGHRSPTEWDEIRFNQPHQPVVGVSWEDAEAFCEWIGGSLPTEAQWEYACRAGTKTPFAIGDGKNISSELANFDGNYPYGNAAKGSYLNKTSPVGSYEPNAWGLHDMHGNVYEWCQDWFGNYGAGAETDPTGPSSGDYRVLRGGSWDGNGRNCRSAYRYYRTPGNRDINVGLRPVLGRSFPSSQPSQGGAPESRPGAGKRAPKAERGEKP